MRIGTLPKRDRRFVSCLLFLLFCFQVSTAQTVIGRQNVDQYPTQSWGDVKKGLTWLPVDYNSHPEKKYPLIIFLHGAGENGTTEGDLWKLLTWGVPKMINNGWNAEAVNPVDNLTYQFIVVSPQAPEWSHGYNSIQWILKDVVNRYRVEESRVYVTGISAGGSGTWSCTLNGLEGAKKFAAIVPVSAAGTNTGSEADQLPLVAGTYKTKAWIIAGTNEAQMSFAQQCYTTINNGNPPSAPAPAPADRALLTLIPGGGHNGLTWDPAYDPTWNPTYTSTDPQMSIYEWMLQFQRLPDGLTANAGTNQTIHSPSSQVTLSGSGTAASGHTITGYAWTQVSGPNTAAIASPSSASTSVTGLTTGTYVFRLTVTDDTGATAMSTVNIIVNAVPVVDAGPNQNISTLTANLAGSATDADGTINSYAWTQVSGPNTATFNSPNSASTGVSNLLAGTYVFRLTATDNRGGTGSATVTVVVTTAGGCSYTQRVEAEAYTSMFGVQTENTGDVGGGQDVGWIDSGDWMEYSVTTPAAGSYYLKLRVASGAANPQVLIRKSDGTVLATANLFNTGGFQNWVTLTYVLTLPAGQQTLRLYSSGGQWNFNWLEFSSCASYTTIPARIEAEDFFNWQGIQTETTQDVNGRLNVGWQDNGDFMDYNIHVPSAGTYDLTLRVSTMFTGPQFQVKVGNNTLATVTVPNTGNFQSWTSVTVPVTLAAGDQTIRILTTNANGGWNLNWLEFSGGSSQSQTVRIQAEAYTAMSGVQTEATGDVGGGDDVAYIDQNDWMDYSVTVNAAGNYYVSLRVASGATGGSFSLRKSDGTVLVTIPIPNTGEFQNWINVHTIIPLQAGTQTIRLYSEAPARFNINWLEFSTELSYTAVPATVQAEAFYNWSGIQTESTSDAGGGLNVGWQDNGDYMDYDISVPSAGSYNVSFRVATLFSAGPQFELRNSMGTVLATVTVPFTGSFQTWQTTSVTVSLPAGNQRLRIVTTNANGGWNLNWIQFAAAGGGINRNIAQEEVITSREPELKISPNPALNVIRLQVNNLYTGKMKIDLVDAQGRVHKTVSMMKPHSGGYTIEVPVSGLARGLYTIRVGMAHWNRSAQLIKQ